MTSSAATTSSKADGDEKSGAIFTEAKDPKRKVIKKAGEFILREKRIPKKRQELLKWHGWGYNDSRFQYDSDGVFTFTGGRYKLSGVKLPHLWTFIRDKFGLDVRGMTPAPQRPMPTSNYFVANGACSPLEQSKVDQFVRVVKAALIDVSLDMEDRVFRSHGHDCHGIHATQNGLLSRIVDAVVWVQSHDDCVKIVQIASDFSDDVTLIPYGGGTCVSGALVCPPGERRFIVSVDTSQMNRIIHIDEENLLVRAEAGIVGQDLEKLLGTKGYWTGHEPDSIEFSSLGGWIATRASGMKKNVYGNIEALVVHLKVVTPRGVVERGCRVPRMSAGPDIHELILGSEGTLGLITEATLKIRPLPTVVKYGSVVFAAFEHGYAFMREVARLRLAPASIRVMDTAQFQISQYLKPESGGWMQSAIDSLKKLYITKWKGFDVDSMAVCTLVFEGDHHDSIKEHERRIYELAAKHGGIASGEENGQRGYAFTFVIAYLRDMAFEFNILGESFETSVPWDRVLNVCRNTKQRIADEGVRLGISPPPFVSCRLTQAYDSGACIYFYFGFNANGLSDPIAAYDRLEVAARDEILACGGSISHHHGIGKLRSHWMPDQIGQVGVDAVVALKRHIDPENVFGANNILPDDVWKRAFEEDGTKNKKISARL